MTDPAATFDELTGVAELDFSTPDLESGFLGSCCMLLSLYSLACEADFLRNYFHQVSVQRSLADS